MSIIISKTDLFTMETYSGIAINPLAPHPDQIEIKDIAHSLTMLCRFNGHVRHFWSVAQHSLLGVTLIQNGVLEIFSEYDKERDFYQTQIDFLLHDSAEAYLSDLITPVKRQLPLYKEYEEKLLHVIYNHFKLPFPNWVRKKQIDFLDKNIMALEAQALMPCVHWSPEPDPNFMYYVNRLNTDEKSLIYENPLQVEQSFLISFDFLMNL